MYVLFPSDFFTLFINHQASLVLHLPRYESLFVSKYASLACYPYVNNHLGFLISSSFSLGTRSTRVSTPVVFSADLYIALFLLSGTHALVLVLVIYFFIFLQK